MAKWLAETGVELPGGTWPTNGLTMTRETYHKRPRLSSKAASATPPAFRDVLLDIARSCLPRALELSP